MPGDGRGAWRPLPADRPPPTEGDRSHGHGPWKRIVPDHPVDAPDGAWRPAAAEPEPNTGSGHGAWKEADVGIGREPSAVDPRNTAAAAAALSGGAAWREVDGAPVDAAGAGPWKHAEGDPLDTTGLHDGAGKWVKVEGTGPNTPRAAAAPQPRAMPSTAAPRPTSQTQLQLERDAEPAARVSPPRPSAAVAAPTTHLKNKTEWRPAINGYRDVRGLYPAQEDACHANAAGGGDDEAPAFLRAQWGGGGTAGTTKTTATTTAVSPDTPGMQVDVFGGTLDVVIVGEFVLPDLDLAALPAGVTEAGDGGPLSSSRGYRELEQGARVAVAHVFSHHPVENVEVQLSDAPDDPLDTINPLAARMPGLRRGGSAGGGGGKTTRGGPAAAALRPNRANLALECVGTEPQENGLQIHRVRHHLPRGRRPRGILLKYRVELPARAKSTTHTHTAGSSPTGSDGSPGRANARRSLDLLSLAGRAFADRGVDLSYFGRVYSKVTACPPNAVIDYSRSAPPALRKRPRAVAAMEEPLAEADPTALLSFGVGDAFAASMGGRGGVQVHTADGARRTMVVSPGTPYRGGEAWPEIEAQPPPLSPPRAVESIERGPGGGGSWVDSPTAAEVVSTGTATLALRSALAGPSGAARGAGAAAGPGTPHHGHSVAFALPPPEVRAAPAPGTPAAQGGAHGVNGGGRFHLNGSGSGDAVVPADPWATVPEEVPASHARMSPPARRGNGGVPCNGGAAATRHALRDVSNLPPPGVCTDAAAAAAGGRKTVVPLAGVVARASRAAGTGGDVLAASSDPTFFLPKFAPRTPPTAFDDGAAWGGPTPDELLHGMCPVGKRAGRPRPPICSHPPPLTEAQTARVRGELDGQVRECEEEYIRAGRAGDVVKQCALLAQLGTAAHRAGDHEVAVTYLSRLLAVLDGAAGRYPPGEPSRGAQVARVCSTLGSAHWFLRDWATALDLHERRLDLARAQQDLKGMGAAYGNIGNVYNSMGRHADAVECHTRHLHLLHPADRGTRCAVLHNMGITQYGAGALRDAMASFEASLELAEEQGNAAQIARLHGNFATVHLADGDLPAAVRALHMEYKAEYQLGDLLSAAATAYKLGHVYVSQRNYKAALGYFDRSEDLYQWHIHTHPDAAVPPAHAKLLVAAGHCMYRLDDCESAVERLTRAVHLAEQCQNAKVRAAALNGLGLCEVARGRPERGLAHHQQHLYIARKSIDKTGEAVAHGNIGDAYEAMRQVSRAVEHFEAQLDIAAGIGCDATRAQALAGLGRCAMRIQHHKGARGLLQDAARGFEAVGDARGLASAQLAVGASLVATRAWREALPPLVSALHISTEGDAPNAQREVEACAHLGTACAAINGHAKALKYHTQRLAAAERVNDATAVARACGDLSDVCAAMGDARKAAAWKQRHESECTALRIHTNADLARGIGRVEDEISSTLRCDPRDERAAAARITRILADVQTC